MPKQPPVPPEDCCGSITRSGSPCRNKKGYKTDHVGSGRCFRHGGQNSGAPKANKNAVSTGEYETIHFSALSPEEQILYGKLETVAPRDEVEREIRLISVREHRILIRIRRATEDEASSKDGLGVASVSREAGTVGWEKTDKTTTDSAPIEERVMRLEDALTRVQALKVRYVDQLRGILKENPPDSGGLDAIVEVLDRSGRAIAQARERERELAEAEDGVLE